MSLSRNRNQKNGQDDVGLLAFGSSGPWEVAIDQTLAGRARQFAQIEGPSVYLYFEIPSIELVNEAIAFLAPQRNSRTDAVTNNGTLSLFKNPDTQVSLVRDNEFGDRYFLVFQTKSGPLARLTVTDDDLRHLVEALHSAKQELDEED